MKQELDLLVLSLSCNYYYKLPYDISSVCELHVHILLMVGITINFCFSLMAT